MGRDDDAFSDHLEAHRVGLRSKRSPRPPAVAGLEHALVMPEEQVIVRAREAQRVDVSGVGRRDRLRRAGGAWPRCEDNRGDDRDAREGTAGDHQPPVAL
jgi:hypothetical protein